MKNKEKVLIGLASFSFFLIVYLVIASDKIEIPREQIKKEVPVVEKIDLKELKVTYQETVSNVYAQLKKETSDVSTSSERINIDDELSKIKNKLITITVPEEYRSFHVSLIILIDKVMNHNFVMDEDFQAELNKIGEGKAWLK